VAKVIKVALPKLKSFVKVVWRYAKQYLVWEAVTGKMESVASGVSSRAKRFIPYFPMDAPPAPPSVPKLGVGKKSKGGKKGLKFFVIYLTLELLQAGAKRVYNYFVPPPTSTLATTTTEFSNAVLQKAKELLNLRKKRNAGKMNISSHALNSIFQDNGQTQHGCSDVLGNALNALESWRSEFD
jgi:hypothetical protein